MVRNVINREKKDYHILAINRSPVGRYSGAKRDFKRESMLKERDLDEFRKWLQDLSLKGDEFNKGADKQWKEWTDKEGGWNNILEVKKNANCYSIVFDCDHSFCRKDC